MASNAFTQCRSLAEPRPPNSLALQNSAAMSSIMKAMGIATCTTTDFAAGVLPYVEVAAGAVSVGCEQVAVLAAALDQSQRAIQCTVSNVSQSSSTSVITANNIILNISGHARVSCIIIDQSIQLKIGTNVEFGNQVKTSMANDLSATMKNLSSVVQNASKDALSTPQGNKTATAFSTYLEQTAFQGSFENIITESIQNFQASNTVTINLTDYAFIGLLNPPANLLDQGCLKITQSIIMEVLSSTIMDNVLAHVFDNSLASDWSNAWIADQTSKANATKLVDITNLVSGIIAIIILVVVVAVVLFMVLKGGGMNSFMSAPEGTPGQRGITIAGVMIAFGIILFIVGIALLAGGWSTWGGGICLAVGLIVGGLGGFLLWRAKQIQKNGGVSKAPQ